MLAFFYSVIFYQDDLNKLLNYFFSAGNPVYYSLVIVIAVYFVITFFFRRNVIPYEHKVVSEKKNLYDHFSEEIREVMNLNPDPVIRFSPSGYVTLYNESALQVFPAVASPRIQFKELFKIENFDFKDFFKSKKSSEFSIHEENLHYYGRLIASKQYNFATAHLHDSSAYFRYEQEYLTIHDKMDKLRIHTLDRMESEKKRIASELHDSVGQVFSAAKMQISRLENIDELSKVKDVYNNSMDLLGDGIRELKDITLRLRPKILEELGLPAAIESLVSRVGSGDFLKGTFDYYGDFHSLTERQEIALFRIAQESISNIVKHSHATSFSIQLLLNQDRIKLLVNDDGRGFLMKIVTRKNRLNKGMGLLNIVERVKLFNGNIKFNTNLEQGTYITIDIPVEKKNGK
ncbi:MAG: sensor histidine kinase [Bacteroidetes bacterium]|nr:sensor histidine kinase [Bacteroidota bacterium]